MLNERGMRHVRHDGEWRARQLQRQLPEWVHVGMKMLERRQKAPTYKPALVWPPVCVCQVLDANHIVSYLPWIGRNVDAGADQGVAVPIYRNGGDFIGTERIGTERNLGITAVTFVTSTGNGRFHRNGTERIGSERNGSERKLPPTPCSSFVLTCYAHGCKAASSN